MSLADTGSISSASPSISTFGGLQYLHDFSAMCVFLRCPNPDLPELLTQPWSNKSPVLCKRLNFHEKHTSLGGKHLKSQADPPLQNLQSPRFFKTVLLFFVGSSQVRCRCSASIAAHSCCFYSLSSCPRL
jgi:hypothetical protein